MILYVSLPVQLWVLFNFLGRISEGGFSTIEFVGMTLSMGLLCGIMGINVAHELGHRSTWYEQTMAKGLLLTSLYMHFFIEHNRGHHKRVATHDDPATARYGESVYVFYVRSIVMSYFSAWKIELARLKKLKAPFISLRNEMLWFQMMQITLVASIYEVYGGWATFGFLGAAMSGILLLETVNYIEHYGLQRSKTDRGTWGRVLDIHSWNSNHVLGRIMLFELSRHSDHHYKASKHYQSLRNWEGSPQLPAGYPGMMLLSLFPPLWFTVMHKQIEKLKLQEKQS
jgi:alkane 1-monooxygenase